MSKRDNSLLIQDMHEASAKIRSYTENMRFSEFEIDDKTIDAVIRNFEIIGEAANRLDDGFKSLDPEIELLEKMLE